MFGRVIRCVDIYHTQNGVRVPFKGYEDGVVQDEGMELHVLSTQEFIVDHKNHAH